MPRIKITKVPKLGKSQTGGQCPSGSSWDSAQQKCVPSITGAQSPMTQMNWGNMGSITGAPTSVPMPPAPVASPISNQKNIPGSFYQDLNKDIKGNTINPTPSNPYPKPFEVSQDDRDAIAKSMGMSSANDRFIGNGKTLMESPNNPLEIKPINYNQQPNPSRTTGNEMVNVAGAVTKFVDNYKKQKAYDNLAASQNLPDNYYAVNKGSDRGWYDKNDGMFDPYNMGYKGRREYGGMIKAAEGIDVPYVGQHFIPEAHVDLPMGFIPPSGQTQQVQQNTGSDIREEIAAKESGGNYRALPKNKDGTLASSAVGKYQFLWNKNKDWIEQVTGVDSKTGFMNDPEAQEKAFDYWDKTVLTPNAMKIKQELGVNAPLDNIKYAIHFAGPAGAYKYFSSGQETHDVYGTSVGKIMNMDLANNKRNMKIRITGTPDEQTQMAAGGQPPYSGQSDYGLYIGQRNLYKTMPKDPYMDANHSVSEKPETEQNPHILEAEGGETIKRPDGTHMEIKGNRHTDGGVKLNKEQAPEGSFIYSDTKKMKIKDPNLLKYFGKSGSKAITPADIAKQYDVNKYRAILADPNTDNLQKNTAKRMIDAYDQKLAELALVQEGKKGFPQGIPDVAKSLVEKISGGKQPSEEQGESQPDNEQQEQQMARYGGGLRRFQGDTGSSTVPFANAPAYSGGPDPNDIGGVNAMFSNAANPPKQVPNWWQWWTKSNTPAGKRSPAHGYSSTYTPGASNPSYEDYSYWRNRYGKDFEGGNDIEKRSNFQKYMFGELQKGNPQAYQHIMDTWGQTAAGKLPDSVFGARTAYGTESRIPPPTTIPPPIETPPIETPPGTTTTTIQPGDFVPGTNKIPYGWTQQDVNNRNAAVANLGLIKKYHMASRNIQPDLPEFVPVDWRGQAAALQSAQNAASNQLGAYMPGQSMASNLSALAGQQGENLGKAISSVDQYNAQGKTANDLQRSNILNTFTQYNAGKRDYDMDYENTADAKYRAALAHAGDRLTAAKNQGITNASLLYDMNLSESPDYWLDPRYQTRQFNSPEAYWNFINRNRGGYQDPSSGNQIDMYNQAFAKATGTPEQKAAAALEYMRLQGNTGKTTSVMYPGNPNRNRYSTTTPMGTGMGGYSGYNPYSGYGMDYSGMTGGGYPLQYP
jgi:hypothetical protein